MSLVAVAAGVAVRPARRCSRRSASASRWSAPRCSTPPSRPRRRSACWSCSRLEVNLLTLLGERRRPAPSWPDVRAVVAWSLPGALAGVAVLRSLDDVALQLLVTAGVLARAGRQPPRRAPARRAARSGSGAGRALAGLASGALNTSTSTGGPPVVLLLMRPRPGARRRCATRCSRASSASRPSPRSRSSLTGTEEAIPPRLVARRLRPAHRARHARRPPRLRAPLRLPPPLRARAHGGPARRGRRRPRQRAVRTADRRAETL